MSYILDALKKSDAEARKGLVPSIHSHHADGAQTTPRPAWQSMLIGALGIALLAIVGMQMFAARPSDSPVAITTVKTAPAVPVIPPATQPAPAILPPVKPVPPRLAKTTVQTQPQNKIERIEPQSAANPLTTKPSPQPLQNTLPLRSELPVSIQQSLPPIQISGHIFDPQPAARMVFINGHIQRQGDSISPQLRLLSITSDGVELEFRGTPFRIDIFRGSARHKAASRKN